jgi:F-type H+-transporting ATPase subunit gamma
MSEVSERAGNRLENLKAIEPLISSLRILSLSTMQMAINRQQLLHTYRQEYYHVLGYLMNATSKKYKFEPTQRSTEREKKTILVVLGSDRGLCGTYNKNLASKTLRWAQTQPQNSTIQIFGTRLEQVLHQENINYKHQPALSKGSVPRYDIAYYLINAWLRAYDQGELTAVEVIATRKVSTGVYSPVLIPLIPMVEDFHKHKNFEAQWPPPIIEGDPQIMIQRTIEHLTAINFYNIILEAVTAENAIRYNLLEEAKENTKELIEELALAVQIQKRQAITQQIQELAVGAGLMDTA